MSRKTATLSSHLSAVPTIVPAEKPKKKRSKPVVESKLHGSTSLVTPTLATILNSEIDGMAVEDLAVAYTLVDFLSKTLEERRKELREAHLTVTKSEGTVPDEEKGHYVLPLESGDTLVAERRKESNPNADLFHAFLKQKNEMIKDEKKKVDWKPYFTQVPTWVINPAAIEAGVATGIFTQEEVNDLRKESWAAKVQHSEVLKALIEEVKAEIKALP